MHGNGHIGTNITWITSAYTNIVTFLKRHQHVGLHTTLQVYFIHLCFASSRHTSTIIIAEKGTPATAEL